LATLSEGWSCAPLVLFFAFLTFVRAAAADWPTWRCDARRSGTTAEELAAELYPQWTIRLGPAIRAWPNEPRLGFDASYEPVVAGQTLVVGSPNDGSVTACEVTTGRPRWRFYAGGPVRFAPVLTTQRVFAGSDDGWLYCLQLADGHVLWQVRGAPEECPERRHLGNNRLISYWPVRGGPVLADGVLYFAAGIWPTLGVYVVAVDAETGAVRWRNGDLATIEKVRLDHNELGDSGLSPQGYLLVHGNRLLVPNGRSMPALLDRNNGQLLAYIQGYRNGDCRVVAGEQVALVGEAGVVDLRTGREVGSRWAAAGADAPRAFDARKFHLFEGPIHPYKFLPGCSWRSVLAAGDAFGLEGGVFNAYDLQRASVAEYDVKNGERVLKPWRWDAPLLWKLGTPQSGRAAAPLVKAGSRLYGHDGRQLVAVRIPAAGQQPQVTWQTACASEPTSLVAAAGRLFVTTAAGQISCFGPERRQATDASIPPAAPPAALDKAAENRRGTSLLTATGIRDGYCVLLGVGQGTLLRELLEQSKLRLIGVDGRREAVDQWRTQLAAQGHYGTRAELLVGDPGSLALPPYLASLMVAQDPTTIGFPDSSPARAFAILRPYGGTACVALPADRQAAFEQWVAAAGLQHARVRRVDDWTLLERAGPLPGSASWTHECADASRSYFSQDCLVQAPLEILWYGDGPGYGFWKHKDYGTGVKPQVVGGRLYAFQIHTKTLMAYDVYTGRLLWQQAVDGFTRYAALADGIYVAGGNRLRVLDPATGAERAAWPLEIAAGQTPFVADIRVQEDVIVAALAPQKVRVIEQGLWDSTTLVALDRISGQPLWKRAAERRFNNHALALGAGLVLAVDSLSPIEVDKAERHGEPPAAAVQPSTVLALDARTGQVRWNVVVDNPFRTYGPGGWTAMRANDDWLAYSQACELVVAGKFNQVAAYEAGTGRRVWQAQIAAGQPWILRGETALTQAGAVHDLRTGQPTGQTYDLRRGGCNYAVANEKLILLRDRSACYVDAETCQKHPLFAVRSGCSNSLVAADGVVSVPNFAVSCICNYPVQTSFAMYHPGAPAAASR
jgi:outer membrane protein assembly factor BamB